MSESVFLTSWRGHITLGQPGLHLTEGNHPLQFFVGVTENGNPRVVVRSSAKPIKPTLSNLVLVDRYQDTTARWNVSFTLQDRKFDEVFLRLFDDAHARSAAAHNEEDALARVTAALDEWRRLLKPRPSGVLSMEELRGLVGELWLMLHRFSLERSMDETVEGWLGPLGLPQDFWFAGSGHSEAKSIGPATTRVKISSAHQLDAEDLELLVLRAATTSEGTAGAVSLPTLVGRIRTALDEETVAAASFDSRLDRLSVNLDEAFYADTWFVVASVTDFAVTDEFPAIRSSGLAPGLGHVLYEIELSAIEEFRTAHLVVA